jgi:replication factor A1
MLERLPEMKPSPELMGRIRVKKKKQLSAAIEQQIKDMYFGANGFNLKAKVVEKSAVREVLSRFGQPVLVSNATLSDGTGSIKLPLWNSQIDTVSVGDTVHIENGRVKTFNGELQLKYSKLSVTRSRL